MATLTDINTRKAELEAKLEAARKAKKGGVKELRAQIDALVAEAEAITAKAAPKKVGRPRKYADEFYTLRDKFARDGSGRPNRETVVRNLTDLGVELDKNASFRDLEKLLRVVRAEALEAAKVVK
jgi:hypothetical protein